MAQFWGNLLELSQASLCSVILSSAFVKFSSVQGKISQHILCQVGVRYLNLNPQPTGPSEAKLVMIFGIHTFLRHEHVLMGEIIIFKRITFLYSAKRREAQAMKLMNVDM